MAIPVEMFLPATVPVIERSIELHQSPERVWRALTEPEEIARWFSPAATIDLRPGGHAAFTWADDADDCGGTYEARVEWVEPHHRFAFRWATLPNTPFEAAATTLVEWELMARPDGGTTLLVRESGFANEADRSANDGGWLKETGELARYLDGAA